ncbi:MAG: RNA polymerase sigma factor [Geminicoccaceae bacterium]|nr:RNA polymerase sigma factor [Geminicoccaceae bacterium]
MSSDKGGGKSQRQTGEELLEHMASLRRYAILLLGSVTDADDVVQETLARILNQSKNLADVRDLRSYMFATLHNICIDDARRQKRSAGQVPIESVLSTLSSPATQHKRLELRDLATAMTRLPIEQREVVLLVGLEGMSYGDAAKTLGVPIGTIMSRLSRGREALRQLTARSETPRLRVVK